MNTRAITQALTTMTKMNSLSGDSLNFHGTSVAELKANFHECIDNYLDMCKQFGVAPDKEYKGSFNVRLEPKLHRDVAFAAEQQGITMNQYVVNALSSAVYT